MQIIRQDIHLNKGNVIILHIAIQFPSDKPYF